MWGRALAGFCRLDRGLVGSVGLHGLGQTARAWTTCGHTGLEKIVCASIGSEKSRAGQWGVHGRGVRVGAAGASVGSKGRAWLVRPVR
jgi:hypothetical protein